jgi:adenosylcobinamide kinase / adenosylcobinamide-phosphate guanylyltransferase
VTRHTTLVLGGARSGKTRRALALAEPFPDRFYIATAEALDAEMRERIAHHRQERGEGWTTIEAPLDLPGAIAALPPGAAAVADCLTLWLSNLMGAGRNVADATSDLLDAIAVCPATLVPPSERKLRPELGKIDANQRAGGLVLVSNEVGLGLVPETPLGRAFRDAQGRLNQAVAARADIVEFVAAGLPLRLKG